MALPDVETRSKVRRIPFAQMGGFSRTFERYVDGDPAISQFFPGDWRDPDAIEHAAAAVTQLSRYREEVVAVLAEQNEAWGNGDARVRQHIESLRAPESAAIVTGQQLGLFGGPLFTLYKAVTAIQLARRESARSGRPYVPVFWLADEDHDWDEVRATRMLARDLVETLELPPSSDRQPVGRRVVGNGVGPLLTAISEALPATEFTGSLIRALEAAYAPGVVHRDAFARWMASLFAGTGLVLMSADEARLKRLAAPVIEEEITRPADSLNALLRSGQALAESGFEQQVTPMAGNLFLMEPEGRFTLDPEDDGSFSVRGLRRRYSAEDLLQRLASAPEDFSPNVVFRPIVQDLLLPTAAYVGGPGEIAYFAQLGPVYERFEVQMPIIYPRASVTLLEARVRRLLDRYNLTPEAIGASEQALEAHHRRLALELGEHDIGGAFERAAAQIHAVGDELRSVAEKVDPTLHTSAMAFRTRLLNLVEAFETKVVRAEKRQHLAVRGDLEVIRNHLYPGGLLQERSIGSLHLINRYGPNFVHLLLGSIEPDSSAHQLLEVG